MTNPSSNLPTRDLIIVRGLPGSGKSFFAKKLALPDFICTADDFLMEDGKYIWTIERLRMAHQKCISKCLNLMRINSEIIVVANTSTSERELKPYLDMAIQYGYRVFSIIVENRHGGKNSHNVPPETLEKMEKRFSIKLI